MRIRTYVALFSTVVVGLVMAFFVWHLRQTIRKGFGELQETQVEYIGQILRSSLENTRVELGNFSKILRADNDLSGTYVLATESGDLDLIQRKLETIKKGIDFQVVDIISRKGTPLFTPGMTLSPSLVEPIFEQGREGIEVVSYNGRPLLLSYSPLKLYDTTVGGLVLGYLLDSVAETRLSKMLNADIDINWGEKKEGLESTGTKLPIFHEENSPPLYASIRLKDSKGDAFARILTSTLLVSSVLGVLALWLLFYLLLDLGFMRGFSSVIKSAEKYTAQLARGELGAFTAKRSVIRENNLIAGAFGKLAETLSAYSQKILEQSDLEARAKRQEELADLASQVAHDIRSPLTALSMVTANLTAVPEKERTVIRLAVNRIRDIANGLLSRYRESRLVEADIQAPSGVGLELVSTLVDSMVSEKRQQISNRYGIQLRADLSMSYGLFARVDPIEFNRMLSNVINNAVEAIPETGEVEVSVGSDDHRVSVVIRDTGKGMAPELIAKLGLRGATWGKSDGTGLGLHHAKTSVEKWGGQLEVESEVGKGTSITIHLPRVTPPDWFFARLVLTPQTTIVVVDDESSIHEIWQMRLESFEAEFGVRIEHFSNAVQVRTWQEKHKSLENVIYLMDYELIGSPQTGLDIIEALQIAPYSVLVTSRFDDPVAKERCISLRVRLLPKTMVPLIPIVMKEQPSAQSLTRALD